jgi:cyclopropane-fatty-acyl-phospholipid synthase
MQMVRKCLHSKSAANRRFGMQKSPSIGISCSTIPDRAPVESSTKAQPDLGRTLGLLARLFPKAASGNVSFKLWDGTMWPDERPRFAMVELKHPDAIHSMFANGTEMGLAEAYLRDDFDVHGDLEAACELADAVTEVLGGAPLLAVKTAFRMRARSAKLELIRLWSRARRWPFRKHSLARDRWAIGFHYDLSNEFYRLWLDPSMIYSCAYFRTVEDDLASAQTAKLRHLCRKLRLQSGQRLLDIGCGWGGLAIFAAKQYGTRVTGITLSKEQASFASRAAADAEIADDVDIQVRDYRELPESECYDAIVSVGMAEHVGAGHLSEYFRKAFRLLKPGGVFLNHAIGDGVRARKTHGRSFIQEYVFPDSDIPRLPFVLAAAESAGFEVRDVENLREHYLHTLRRWVHRLEATHDAALEFVNEPTYRVWRLYMAGSARGFAQGRLAVYQTLLAKPDKFGGVSLPLTRGDWYCK